MKERVNQMFSIKSIKLKRSQRSFVALSLSLSLLLSTAFSAYSGGESTKFNVPGGGGCSGGVSAPAPVVNPPKVETPKIEIPKVELPKANPTTITTTVSQFRPAVNQQVKPSASLMGTLSSSSLNGNNTIPRNSASVSNVRASAQSGFVQNYKSGTPNSSVTKIAANSTVIFEGDGRNFAVNSTSSKSNSVQIASNGRVQFGGGENTPTVGVALAYRASAAPASFTSDLREEIVNDLNSGKTSGSGSGASSNQDDATFKRIVDEFKKSASTKTWEEVSADLKSEGYDVSGTIQDTFKANLNDGRTAQIKVTGSWKELYSKLQKEAQEKAAREEAKKAEREKQKQERIAREEEEKRKWEALPEEEKQKILAERERQRQIEIGKQKEREAQRKAEEERRQREWEALSPEEQAKIIAEREADKVAREERKAQEKAQREKEELEKYKNEYFYTWDAEFYNIPKTDTPSTPPQTAKQPDRRDTVITGNAPIIPMPSFDKLMPIITALTAPITNAIPALAGLPALIQPVVTTVSSVPASLLPVVAFPTFYKPTPTVSTPGSVPAVANLPVNTPEELPAVAVPTFYKPTPNGIENESPSVGAPVYYKGMW